MSSALQELGVPPDRNSALRALGADSIVVPSHVRSLPGKKQPGIVQRIAQSAVENAVPIGATIGGGLGALEGGIGAIPGAAAGGAVGRAAQMALSPLVGLSDVSQPPSVPQQATSIAGAGLAGGLQEVGGKVLPGVARLTGKALMRAALFSGRSLGAEFPGLAGTAVGSGSTGPLVGQMVGARLSGLRKAVMGQGSIGIEGGAPKVDALREASSATEKKLADMYDANGVSVPLQNISQRLVNNADQHLMFTQGRHILPEEAGDIHRQVVDYAQQKLGRQVYGAGKTDVSLLTPQQTLVLKQEASNDVKPLFRARSEGRVPAGNPDLAAAVHTATMQEIADRMPQMDEQAKVTQKLIGLHRAMIARENPGEGAQNLLTRVGERSAAYSTVAAMGGLGGTAGYVTGGSSPEERLMHGLAGAGLGMTLGSPQALSLAALISANPTLGLLLQQAGRSAGAAVGQNWSQP